jgi:hypothetical protein
LLLSTLMLVTDWYAYMFCYIGLQATTTKISSYMVCQCYWKMYHWQSQHDCCACMMVLRHILAVLCEMFLITTIKTDGWAGEHPVHVFTLVYFVSSGFLLWVQLKTLVCAAPVDKAKALHHRIVDACQTTRNYPGIYERLRLSMMRRIEGCIKPHGHFEHLI